jgi:NAD+ kinase
MERVGIVAHCQRDAALSCARELRELLQARSVRVRLARDLGEALQLLELIQDEPELGEQDCLVALGGDGTLLAANRLACPHRTPVLGVHVGGPASFGFLTETTPSGALDAMKAVLEGRFRVEERIMIRADVSRQGRMVARFSGLNDLVIRAYSRMLKLRVEIEGLYIATYAADGIIVATPTGSTAYNLAAGGPLVHPSVQTLLLTPICPHTLNVRSLLVGVDSTLQVRLETGERDTTQLTVDGQVSFQLEPYDQLVFRRAERPGRFISLDPRNFYQKVHTRLRLGERFGS